MDSIGESETLQRSKVLIRSKRDADQEAARAKFKAYCKGMYLFYSLYFFSIISNCLSTIKLLFISVRPWT